MDVIACSFLLFLIFYFCIMKVSINPLSWPPLSVCMFVYLLLGKLVLSVLLVRQGCMLYSTVQ